MHVSNLLVYCINYCNVYKNISKTIKVTNRITKRAKREREPSKVPVNTFMKAQRKEKIAGSLKHLSNHIERTF